MAEQYCPLCDSRTLRFLLRANVPVQQNFIFPDRASAKSADLGDLDMRICEQCGFVHNAAFEQSKVKYGEQYDNAQTHSPSFASYLAETVRYLTEEANVRECRVVEVGCGDGGFLRQLVRDERLGNWGYGFDPSYNGPASGENGRLQIQRRYYNSDCAELRTDVVICRHVIEHVPRPLDLLRAMRSALTNSAHARVFIETPCVDWILSNAVFWDFFYEHCSLFSSASLTTACQIAGFKVQRVRHLFGGQYLWLEATLATTSERIDYEPNDLVSRAFSYAKTEEKLRESWRTRLLRMTETGATAVWGAGAKGVTFVNLMDPACKLVDCLIDLNPNKQGKFVPVTGHSIIDYHDISLRSLKTAICMNPNYIPEIEAMLHEAGIALSLAH